MRLFASPATKAGQKAGKAWLRILEQTDEEIETLTGLDLYTHAREEARKWLRSLYRNEQYIWRQRELEEPEQRYHEKFTTYLEAFISVFPPRQSGYPKDETRDSMFDYLEEA